MLRLAFISPWDTGYWFVCSILQVLRLTQRLSRKKLHQSFSAQNIEGELANYQRDGMQSFQRPYGIAWLLQLTAELRQSDHPQALQWLNNLLPLERLAVSNMSEWLPKLSFPIRTGEHSQTAFAFGLMLDWSRVAGDSVFEKLLTQRIEDLYRDDKDCPLEYEPSGHDFLSPCLAEADLMRRVMDTSTYAAWLKDFFSLFNSRERHRLVSSRCCHG